MLHSGSFQRRFQSLTGAKNGFQTRPKIHPKSVRKCFWWPATRKPDFVIPFMFFSHFSLSWGWQNPLNVIKNCTKNLMRKLCWPKTAKSLPNLCKRSRKPSHMGWVEVGEATSNALWALKPHPTRILTSPRPSKCEKSTSCRPLSDTRSRNENNLRTLVADKFAKVTAHCRQN